jgi:hypothetical protein
MLCHREHRVRREKIKNTDFKRPSSVFSEFSVANDVNGKSVRSVACSCEDAAINECRVCQMLCDEASLRTRGTSGSGFHKIKSR